MSTWNDRNTAQILTALREHAGVRLKGKTSKPDLVELVRYWLGDDPDNPELRTPDPDPEPLLDLEVIDLYQPTIAEAMVAIMRAVTPIAKNQRNVESNYAARSIDDVLDALHAIMADAGVFVLPIVDEATHRDVQTRNATQREATLRVRFRFTGPRGDYVDAVMEGEGLDVSDKATNKAQSAALKYCLLQTFIVPIKGGLGPDADETTPERVPESTNYYVEDDQKRPYLDRIAALSEPVRDAFREAWRAAAKAGQIATMKELTDNDVPLLNLLLGAFESIDASEPEREAEPDVQPKVESCEECGFAPGFDHAADCSMRPADYSMRPL